MELFPAQPDLSLQLQISPPNASKPASANPSPVWRRPDPNTTTTADLPTFCGWKRGGPDASKPTSDAAQFDLALSRPTTTSSSIPNLFHHHYNHQHHLYQQLLHQHQQASGGLGPELGFLRPIRGIPVYQNPAASFPFVGQPALDSHPSSTVGGASLPNGGIGSGAGNNSLPYGHPHHHNHHHHNHHQSGVVRSRFLSRFPAKRSMRAPRMRWTSTLHARFVHAVELLGGHESKLLFNLICKLIKKKRN